MVARSKAASMFVKNLDEFGVEHKNKHHATAKVGQGQIENTSRGVGNASRRVVVDE